MPLSHFVPASPPPRVLKSVFYVYVFIPALPLGSSVPFLFVCLFPIGYFLYPRFWSRYFRSTVSFIPDYKSAVGIIAPISWMGKPRFKEVNVSCPR